MDLETGAKLLYCSLYNWNKEEAVNLDDEKYQELWNSLTEEGKASYRKAAHLLMGTAHDSFRNSLKDNVFFIEDGKLTHLMTIRELHTSLELLKSTGVRRHYERYYADLPTLLEQAIQYLHRRELAQVTKLKSFQDDMLTYLRSITLIATSIGNAYSHAEKDARLRGLISIIESGIQVVRDGYESMLESWVYDKPDLFRSDYPVRAYIEKNKQLEAEIKELREARTNELINN